jgi:hypothetical protein
MPVRHDRRSNAARPSPACCEHTRPGCGDTSRRTTCRGPPGLARHAQPAMRPEAGFSACRAGPPKAPWPVAARRASHQARRLSGPRLPQLDLLPAVAGPSPPQGDPADDPVRRYPRRCAGGRRDACRVGRAIRRARQGRFGGACAMFCTHPNSGRAAITLTVGGSRETRATDGNVRPLLDGRGDGLLISVTSPLPVNH